MSIKSPLSRQFGSRFDSVFDVVKSNPVYDKVSRIPTLDLDFAKSKSLYDGRSTKNLIDFVRNTAPNSSTYVDAAGLIKRSVTNLLLRSEEFDNAAWTKTRSSITSNTIVAPDGTLTGDKLVEDTTASNTHQVSQPASLTAGTHTYSIFAKAGERSVLQTFRANLNIDLFTHTFNLSTGTASGTGASIVSVGNGWYLCISTVTVNTTGSTGINFSINNGSTNSYTGDGTSGIYLWGAQLEEASTAGEYVKTTATKSSAPRFDHDPTTGESLGLLMEESRQNLATQSESFSTWTVSGQGTTQSTDVGIVAPDGSTGNVQLFTEDLTTGPHRIFVAPTTEQTTKTHSVFVKAATGTREIYLSSDGPTGTRQNIEFDLQTGDIVVNSGDWSGVFITPYSNGWYRIGGTITDNGGSTLFIIGMKDVASSYTGDGTSGFYLWGAQLEAGSFPTSYIPTTTAEATRAADVASISGSNFSSWYRQDEGTVFAQTQVAGYSSTNNPDLVALFGANFVTDRIIMFVAGASPNYRAEIKAGNINQLLQNVVSVANIYDSNNFAIAYKENDSVSYGRNTNATDTLVTLPVITSLNFSGSVGSTKYIRRLTYWDTRLPNEKLKSVTA
jgi:hypothetical protein